MEARKTRITDWLPLVKVIAASELRRLGSLARLLQIDFDDLFQTGVVGLILAVDQFNPELASARTYFTRRIRGNMLDFLRSFPYFKEGRIVERVSEGELDLRPTHCAELERAEIHLELETLMNFLSVKQRSVMLGVLRETPQHLLARSLCVNESRVSQIKNESLAALQSVCSVQFREQRPA